MSSKLIADKSCVSSAKILHWQGLARSASLHLRPQITCKVIGILGKDEQVPILTVAAGGVFAPTSPSSQNARIGTDWGPFFQICCNLPIGKSQAMLCGRSCWVCCFGTCVEPGLVHRRSGSEAAVRPMGSKV